MLMRRRVLDSPKPFDVSNLEREIDDQLRALPAPVYAPDPPPVPVVSAEDLARITSDAIKAAHEAAVESLESLCGDIEQRVEKIEQLKAESMKQIEECRELAEKFRDAGKIMALQVESATQDLSDARSTIEGVRNKINS